MPLVCPARLRDSYYGTVLITWTLITWMLVASFDFKREIGPRVFFVFVFNEY